MVKKATKKAVKVEPKVEPQVQSSLIEKAFDPKSEPKVVVTKSEEKVEPKPMPKPKTEKGQTNGFVFTGDPVGGNDPQWISMHGYMFGLNGRVVEVTDEIAAKLRTHSHFTEK